MVEYGEMENYGNANRQKDIVLATNEYCHVLSKTSGDIKTYCGPIMLTISQQESLVIFNSNTKRFEETQDFKAAKQLFVSAPEGWYVMLKNPAKNGEHPSPRVASQTPELEIGKKINIYGPASFSLFPGQMAKIVQGHRLRSNQYLLARVYDADAAQKHCDRENEYYQGQLLVIKGTEISFYIPPTGIEVIPVGGKGDNYIRDAVTLERLEYAILKDENGEKVYKYGPDVVFPEPTQTFLTAKDGGYCFRAIELSPISGIYIKVIAPYKDEDGIEHPVGEELFITGNDQMIYYPRPEHATITYDDRIIHHAIAIPKDEGRYIMNRETGEIKTVIGPNMYLPDPRYEVVVKRKLSINKCALWYPGNSEVMQYNNMRKSANDLNEQRLDFCAATSSTLTEKTLLDMKAIVSRGNNYKEPRSITFDNKYDGAVKINVWGGYAVSVLRGTGERRIVVGPETILLDYEENLEPIFKVGQELAYLPIENEKINFLTKAFHSDGIPYKFNIECIVDFDIESKDKWFNVKDYGEIVKKEVEDLISNEMSRYTIDYIYDNYADLIKDLVEKSIILKENGIMIKSIYAETIEVPQTVKNYILEQKDEVFRKRIEKESFGQKVDIDQEIGEFTKQTIQIRNEVERLKLMKEAELNDLKYQNKEKESDNERALLEKRLASEEYEQERQLEMEKRDLALVQERDKNTIEQSKAQAAIEEYKQKAYADAVSQIMQSISPDLTAALNERVNVEIAKAIGEAVSPYSMANGESVGETASVLLRGTGLEDTIGRLNIFKNK